MSRDLQIFQRPASAPSVQLQPRDRAIIQAVAEHRFLDSEMIHALIGGSRVKLTRRLQKLYQAGFLERPENQVVLRIQEAQRAYIYSLGPCGVQVVAHDQGLHPRAKKRLRDRARAYRRRSYPRLRHDLEAARFRVALSLAAQKHPQLELTSWGASRIRGRLQGAHKRLWPDWGFKLQDPDTGKCRRFYVEVDMNTMSKRRFQEKLQIYRAHWKANKSEPFQVLTVTPDEARARELREVARALWPKSRMFLFTESRHGRLEPPDSLLQDPVFLVPAEAKRRSLLSFD